jgi:hypothetical protein
MAPHLVNAQSSFCYKQSKISFYQEKNECVCAIGKYAPPMIFHTYVDIVETKSYKKKCMISEKLVDCMWNEESSRGKNLKRGDHGLAYGHFQIHLIDNPEVTEECAMDYECSKQWTINQLEIGNCWKWPSYYRCI